MGKTSGILANVGHEFNAGSYASHTRDGDVALYLNRKTSDGTIQEFRKDNTNVGTIGTASSKLHIASTGNSGIRFRDDLNGIIPCNADGSNSDADQDLGHTGVRYRRLYLSEGVFLGGTGTANKLDDYEEGTWTPAFDSGVSGSSYSRQYGRYTKIGNKVFFEFDIQGNGNTAATSQVRISGFPFTSNSSAPYGGGVMNYGTGIYTSEQLLFHIGGNDTIMYLYQLTGSNFLGTEAVDINDRIIVYGQYTTA